MILLKQVINNDNNNNNADDDDNLKKIVYFAGPVMVKLWLSLNWASRIIHHYISLVWKATLVLHICLLSNVDSFCYF